MTDAAASAKATEERAVFSTFLRYDAPTVHPGLVAKRVGNSGDAKQSDGTEDVITLLDEGNPQYHTSIPAAKLMAAKSAAREAYLNSQESAPVSSFHYAGEDGGESGGGSSNGRKDPAHRLPTPPIAGHRAIGKNRKAGKKEHEAHVRSAATITAAPAPPPRQNQQQITSSSSSWSAAQPLHQEQRDMLSSLMRTTTKPDSFLAQVLNGMFPPRMEVMDVEAGDGDGGGGSHRQNPAGGPSPARPLDAGSRNSAEGREQSEEHHKATTVKPIRLQCVSRAPVTREDVALLHDALRHRLQERRAKPSDLCPIRREIYDDVFCELIRQITVEEPARGVLLQRIKEDAEHTREVHADLLARAHFFAALKTQEARQEREPPGDANSGGRASARRGQTMGSLQEKLAKLTAEKAALEARRHELHVLQEALERRIDEERLAKNKVYQEELSYLRRANQQLSLRLKAETERASSSSPAPAATSNNGSGDNSAGIRASG